MTWAKNVNGDLVVIETLDAIPNGVAFVKSEKNFTAALESKLIALSATPQTADEVVTLLNTASLKMSADVLEAGTTNKLLTATALAGADLAATHLEAGGVKSTAQIGGTVASDIETKANDAFQKGSDTLDDVVEGTLKKSVNAEYVGTSGEITAIHDGTTKRGVGVANGIPIMDANARIGSTTLPETALVADGGGKIVKSDGGATPMKIDDLAFTGDYKPVKTKTGEEDLRTNTLFSDPLLSLTGGATQRLYNTQSTAWTMFCAIPVVFDNLDLNLKMKILGRLVAGSQTPKGYIRIICRDDDGGKPDDSVFVNNYTEIEITDAVFNRGDITKLDFFNAWSLTEGEMYWLTIEGKVDDASDELEMAGPLIYTESKILS
jgi:hypothetical protein